MSERHRIMIHQPASVAQQREAAIPPETWDAIDTVARDMVAVAVDHAAQLNHLDHGDYPELDAADFDRALTRALRLSASLRDTGKEFDDAYKHLASRAETGAEQ